MGVGPIGLLGNPIPDSPRERSDLRWIGPLPVWKGKNRETDFQEESLVLAEQSTGGGWDRINPLPDLFLSKVGPTPVLQNSTED